MKANELINMWDTNMDAMMKKDEVAKEAGRLVGRYVRFQMADGYAFYQIIRENKKTVRVRVVTDIGDDYVHPFVGEESLLDKDMAVGNIEQRDSWKAFAERSHKR